jgi:hypothetical protein
MDWEILTEMGTKAFGEGGFDIKRLTCPGGERKGKKSKPDKSQGRE